MQIAQKSVSKSIQNECAADTAGGVQRGLGVLTQQAKFAKIARREIVKSGKWIRFPLLANLQTCTGLHCLPSSDLLYIGLKLFPTWECLRNNFVPNWHEVLTSIIYFRPTWSEVKFLKFHTPKDNFIPIWDEVKPPRFITFRQVVGKFFCKNQSPAECRGLMRNLNLSFGATCTEVTDMGSV